MRTGLSAALVNTGMIFLGFGFTIAVIWWLGAQYGAAIHKQPILAAIGLIVGGAMFGAGMMMGRTRR